MLKQFKYVVPELVCWPLVKMSEKENLSTFWLAANKWPLEGVAISPGKLELRCLNNNQRKKRVDFRGILLAASQNGVPK